MATEPTTVKGLTTGAPKAKAAPKPKAEEAEETEAAPEPEVDEEAARANREAYLRAWPLEAQEQR